MLTLRWYQKEAVAACWAYLCRQRGNPLIVLPCGSGKSVVIAQLVRDTIERFDGRVIVLAHRQELLVQNAEKIQALLPDMRIGVYSAGLGQRDTHLSVVVAGIQSVYEKAMLFDERHLVIVDEAHLIPLAGEGMYRQFLADVRTTTPKARVVGLTATPFRLDCGPVCRPDSPFQKVCYSADIHRMILDGYLCQLTTRTADGTVDTTKLHLRGGEFVPREMADLFGGQNEITQACHEIVEKTAGRKSVLIFCAGVEHAERVAEEVAGLSGERCGLVTGETSPLERAATLGAFKQRQLRFLVNVDVLSTGFDSPCIDAICILRATMSAGLYSQIAGRGFRVFDGKSNCAILDFGQNIARHGPLDAIDYGRCKDTGTVVGEAPTKTCPNCGSQLLIATQDCRQCGFEFPPPRRRHDDTADTESKILSEPMTWTVEAITYCRHEKKNGTPDDPPTLRVMYEVVPEGGGENLERKSISEWICIEHSGFAFKKAVRWWQSRSIAPMPTDVDEAVDLANRGAVASARTITTIQDGRWLRIVAADLDEKPEAWADEVSSSGFDDEVPF